MATTPSHHPSPDPRPIPPPPGWTPRRTPDERPAPSPPTPRGRRSATADPADAVAPIVPPVDPVTTIVPWDDPIVDERGHDPRSAYVERYWLGVIGPTATLIMRRFADEFDREPAGFVIDLAHTASTMGLSFTRGQHSPFGKALHRCVMFGLAQPNPGGLQVRRMFPNVAQRHLARLPVDVQQAHYDWARRAIRVDRRDLEQRLVALGIDPRAAARASEAAALAS